MFKSDSQRRAVFAQLNKFAIDPERIALRRYGKEMHSVPMKRSGRDRDVYFMDEDKVLKVAKHPEGLIQNVYEGDSFLDIVPEVHERGEDYVVVERADRDDPRSLKFLKPMRAFAYLETDPRTNEATKRLHEFQDALQKVDEEYGTDTSDIVANYTFAYNDFIAPRNWGWRNDMPKLVDPGALSVEAVHKLPRTDPTMRDWRDILYERRKARKELDLDKMNEGERAVFTHIPDIEIPDEKPYTFKERRKDVRDLIFEEFGKEHPRETVLNVVPTEETHLKTTKLFDHDDRRSFMNVAILSMMRMDDDSPMYLVREGKYVAGKGFMPVRGRTDTMTSNPNEAYGIMSNLDKYPKENVRKNPTLEDWTGDEADAGGTSE